MRLVEESPATFADVETAIIIDVAVSDRESMDRNLNQAVDELMELAARSTTYGSQGILVTRLLDSFFRVQQSSLVPFGYIAERDCRRGS